MAERRMFSKSLTETDDFLDMPASTQNLYFHLGLNGDDDGFVSAPKKIARYTGASAADLKLLCEKGYLISFPSGVVVITHWKVSNSIQKDRYRPTQYIEEFSRLELSQSGVYSLKKTLDTDCIQTVSKMETQDRLGKDKLNINIYAHSDEMRTDESEQNEAEKAQVLLQEETQSVQVQGETLMVETAGGKRSQSMTPALFEAFWKAYPKKRNKPRALKAWKRLKVNETILQMMLQAIERSKRSPGWQKEGGQFIPYPESWLNGRRWEDEESPQETNEPTYDRAMFDEMTFLDELEGQNECDRD